MEKNNFKRFTHIIHMQYIIATSKIWVKLTNEQSSRTIQTWILNECIISEQWQPSIPGTAICFMSRCVFGVQSNTNRKITVRKNDKHCKIICSLKIEGNMVI